MPKKVDHHQRRTEIAGVVARIVRNRGLEGVSFREVAAEAGVSVSLVQHYMGSKENLLIGTLNIQSAQFADLIRERLALIDSDDDLLRRLKAMLAVFIPDTEATRAGMLLYHAFAGAALTDERLRSSEAFRSADSLVQAIEDELRFATEAGAISSGVDIEMEAKAILSLVLGLSLAILLDRTSPEEALAVLDHHLTRLQSVATSPGRGTAV
jgi:AcrR family transcriptional regulator